MFYISFQGISLHFSQHRGGAGAPIRDEYGNTNARRVINFKKDSHGGNSIWHKNWKILCHCK